MDENLKLIGYQKPPTIAEITRKMSDLGTDNLSVKVFKDNCELQSHFQKSSDKGFFQTSAVSIIKGDILKSSNYKGIILLNTAHRVFSMILCNFIWSAAESEIGNFQGFTVVSRLYENNKFRYNDKFRTCY